MNDQEIVVKKISDIEFWVGTNHTILDKNNIIYVTADGLQTDKIAHEQSIINQLLSQQIQGKVNYLIDLNKAGKSSPEARKQWRKISEDEKTDKVALYGLHPVARVMASFVMGVSNKKDMLFFKTKEEALKWIHEKA